MAGLLTSLLVLLTVVLSCVLCQEYHHFYIAPNVSMCHEYQNGSCFTLEQIAQSHLLTDQSSLSLNFLPGIHVLPQFGCFGIYNVSFVEMYGQNPSSSVILLGDESQLEVLGVNFLLIENLNFTQQLVSANQSPFAMNDVYEISIVNSIFNGLNSIIIRSTHYVYVHVRDSVFKDSLNTALDMRNPQALMEVLIDNCVFTRNHGYEGGAVAIESRILEYTEIVINSSTFTSNDAFFGGAIFLSGGSASILNCSLKNNGKNLTLSVLTDSEGGAGGAIFIQQHTSLTIIHSAFIENTAYNGGAIHTSSHAGTLYITGNTFAMNTAAVGGAISVFGSKNVLIDHGVFNRNHARNVGGVVSYQESPRYTNLKVELYNSTFTSNDACLGGAIFLSGSNASILKNALNDPEGGAIFLHQFGSSSNNVTITHSAFSENTASIGGAIRAHSGGTLSIAESTFKMNIADAIGGAISTFGPIYLHIHDSKLMQNTAIFGGAVSLYRYGARVRIENSVLMSNIAHYRGAALDVAFVLQLDITRTSLIHNSCENMCNAINILQSTVTFSRENMITNNYGPIHAFSSTLNFIGVTVISSNIGGGIIANQSQVCLDGSNGNIEIFNNTATLGGGGIFLRESTLSIIGFIILLHNNASDGGAIYSFQSTIKFKESKTIIESNFAYNNGGGITAIASTVGLEKSVVVLDSNKAMNNGGGISLQNGKVFIRKLNPEYADRDLEVKLDIVNNTAAFGGGIHVNDNTTIQDACRERGKTEAGSFLGECFLQTIRLHDVSNTLILNTTNTFVMANSATQGSAIFGGLLDRCTPSPAAELYNSYIALSGLDYVRKSVVFSNDSTISSEPLQVKQCNTSATVFARKGEAIRLHVKAVDQVMQPVNATIRGSAVTDSGIGRLKEGQAIQEVGSECTWLEYNVFSEDSTAKIELYAEGPCNNLGLSKLTFNVLFLPCTCPLGFQPLQSLIECVCECDPKLQAHQITTCFFDYETILLESNTWIGVFNETEYLVHDCPFNYCVDRPVNISLNNSQQIDRQCAYNRSGILCGECDEGLSLVFATSRCKECSNIFLLLLIPFIVAGIALISFILCLNVTTATGTIYGLLFYANMLATNKSLFLPFKSPNFLTVFFAWVNLDLGIETCFYDGMDSQAKVLLQLAFPVYLFLLMFLIIILSKYFSMFTKLLSTRNPVAALCTLILLSYSKLLRFIIAALQFTVLDYPNGSSDILWLYNANVKYFSANYAARFVAAGIILIGCALFTVLLLFGQCFSRCSMWKVMKWTNNTKYIGFMDAFHAPFTPKRRYWVGLLLFALIIQNTVSAMASSTFIPVLSAGCITFGLVFVKLLNSHVYKTWINNALESAFILNVGVLSIATIFIGSASNVSIAGTRNIDSQISLAIVSMAIAFILFVLIICCHFYKYALKKKSVSTEPSSVLAKLKPSRRLWKKNHGHQVVEIDQVNCNCHMALRYGEDAADDRDKYITPPIITPATRPDQLREPDLDILAPITTQDYRLASPKAEEKKSLSVCTKTIVEITN